MSALPTKKAIAIAYKPKIELIVGEHFAYRMIQHNLSLGGIGSLQSKLCQVRLGTRVAVYTNGVILVAERTREDIGVLITGWHATEAQIQIIMANTPISVNLGKGVFEDILIKQ